MSSKKIINDPYLNDFVYELIYSSSREQRQRLPAKYNKLFNSSAKAQAFSVKSSIELKQLILSLLGVNWFMVFADNETLPKDMKDVMNLFKKGEKAKALQEMVKKRIYVYSDKQYLDMFGRMADTDHHPSYSFNIDLKKTGYHIQKWKKKLSAPENTETIETKNLVNDVVDLFTAYQSTYEAVSPLLGMRDVDLRILLLFYKKRHSYVSEESIEEMAGSGFSARSVRTSIRRNKENLFIQMTSVNKAKEYTITGLGINQVNQFTKQVLKNFNYA